MDVRSWTTTVLETHSSTPNQTITIFSGGSGTASATNCDTDSRFKAKTEAVLESDRHNTIHRSSKSRSTKHKSVSRSFKPNLRTSFNAYDEPASASAGTTTPVSLFASTATEGQISSKQAYGQEVYNPCCNVCSSHRGSYSNRPVRSLNRSNSYPPIRTTELDNRQLKPGRSCEQLLVKTSYIPLELVTSHSDESNCNATGSVISEKSLIMKDRYISLSVRILSLFSLGVVFAVLLNFLQRQKKVTIFSPGLFGDVLNCEWWMPPAFGLGSTVVGLLYPFMDRLVGTRKSLTMEWSNVMRCIAIFVGINHATAKINFESNIHLALTLTALSLGLWYFFDQSLMGLSLCILGTGIATVITQLLVAANVFGYSNPDFLYMRSWVPCLYFSGGITIGVVGRALAKLDVDQPYAVKEHMD